MVNTTALGRKFAKVAVNATEILRHYVLSKVADFSKDTA